VLAMGVLFASVALGLGFLNWLHPAFDTISNFRLHLAAGFLAVLPLLWWLRLKTFIPIALVLSGVGFTSAQEGLWFLSRDHVSRETTQYYTFLHFNMLWINEDRQAVINMIKREDPDFISLSESAKRFDPFLNQLEEIWPHNILCPEPSERGGVRLYSKYPFQGKTFCGPFGSYARQTVTLPGQNRSLTLVGVHLRWPWPASGPKQVEALIPQLESLPATTIVAGDFNATPWSHTVRRFARAGNLDLYEHIGPTWVVEWLPPSFFWWLGFPIDQVMGGSGVHVRDVRVGDATGSDHFPLIVRVITR